MDVEIEAAKGGIPAGGPRVAGHISDPRRAADTLAAAPEFAGWAHQDVARLVPYVWEITIRAGEYLCQRGAEAAYAFCLLEGTVCYVEAGGRTATAGFVGHETTLNAPAYLSDVAAVTDVVALVVPKHVLRHFGITLGGETLYHSLLAHYATPAPAAAPQVRAGAEPDEAEVEEGGGHSKTVGWILALVVPAIILAFGQRVGLSWQQQDFLAALSVGLLMMSFNLTAQYAAALIAALTCLLLNVAPANVVLSGFASEDFFMGLGIFGLGAVLTSSGLIDRLILTILKHSPESPFWYNLNILLTGVFMTPCLPSANTRVAVMTPLVKEASRALGYRDGSREATRLMFSMFAGASLFAPIFLTAKSLNFIVYSLMPQQVREQYQWLDWTKLAAVAGLVMLGLYLLVSAIVFRRGQKPRLSRTHLNTQLCLLGPMRPAEWTALVITLTFIVAIVTYSVHKISPAWITLAVLCVFLVLGTIDEEHIRHNFQWDVLLLIGFFIGLEDTLDYTGLAAMLTSHLGIVTQYMTSNFVVFILLLFLFTSLLRLFLPITTAGVLIASVFLPLAALDGVNPWVVGFVIITLSEIWFWPSQCSYFQTFEEASGERPVHDRSLFLRLNAASMAFRLVALLASIPFFHHVGLL